MKNKSPLYRRTIKKSLPFLFSIILLFTGLSARANFSNGILGPNQAVSGSLLNYSYVFMTTPPTSYPMPVSARLDIVGGVFVLPQGTTTTIYNPVINGTTNFQVRWQTTGKITSSYVMGNIPYVSNNGQVSGTLVYNVTVVADIPAITFVFNGDPNGLGRNKTYTVTAANAANYEWTTTGDVSIISKSGGNATIQTGPDFTTGSIQVRGQNVVNWSAWKSISLNFDCSVPAGLYIKGDYDGNHIYRIWNGGSYSYKFRAIVSNALEYEWKVEGGGYKINSIINGNIMDIKLYSGFSHIILSVRARKNCGWSAWVYYDVFEYKGTTDPCAGKTNPTAPTDVYITTTLDNTILCSPGSGNATIHANGGNNGYVWFINNGCMTSFSSSCTVNSGGPWSNNNTNFTMNSSNIGSYFDTEIAVRVYYCGGDRYVQANKIISGSRLNCAREESASEELLNESTEATSDKLILYPNPVQDLLHIGGCENIRIFNSQGQMVKEINENVEVLDVQDLTKGIYILKATRNGLPVSSTFTKE